MIDPIISKQVYTRDGWKCRHCSSRNNLTPHHLVYRSHGGEDTINNLVTLCMQCHDAHHNKVLHINFYETISNTVVVTFTRLNNWRPK